MMNSEDPRWVAAREHPELNLNPPPLFLCAHGGCCVNTVLTDGEFCPFHFGEAEYLAARDAAWARYHDLTAGATLALQRGEATASQFKATRDALHAELDDTLTAARKAAGYQS